LQVKERYAVMITKKIPYEKSRSRRHYTSKGKCKETYGTMKDAEKYINKHRLYNMRAYFCNVCNKYHIGHYNILDKESK